MNSFDLYSQERILNSFNDNIISGDNLIFSEIKSTREKNPNNIISSPIIQAQNILKLNNSNDNIKNNSLNSFLYKSIQNSPSENYSNIEYDNKINELKEKLRALKEHNKISINNINLMKLRINKLQSEEKASIRELENTQQRMAEQRVLMTFSKQVLLLLMENRFQRQLLSIFMTMLLQQRLQQRPHMAR